MAAFAVWLADRAFGPPSARPLELGRNVPALDDPAPDPAPPPYTEGVFVIRRADAFHGVYESRLPRDAVEAHYDTVLTTLGFARAPGSEPEPAAVPSGDTVDGTGPGRVYRRKGWLASLRFFSVAPGAPPPPGGCEFSLAIMPSGGRPFPRIEAPRPVPRANPGHATAPPTR